MGVYAPLYHMLHDRTVPWWREDPNTTKSGPSWCPLAKQHLNGISLACRKLPKIEYWLGSFEIFQGIWTSIAKRPYIFVIFQGGGGPDPCSPSVSAHGRVSRYKYMYCK